jgi:FAD binding domain
MTNATPNWEMLDRVIDGPVALPGSFAYEASRPTFDARFDELRPKAILSCVTAQDISEAISFARRHGEAIATRSGGHGFAGRSSTRRVVIDDPAELGNLVGRRRNGGRRRQARRGVRGHAGRRPGDPTFGVVTSLIFLTVPAPEATNVHISWPFSRAADVIGPGSRGRWMCPTSSPRASK